MEDKYIRASKAILDKMGGKYVPLRVLLVAETIKAEIEREEPLVPGVRYRNTEANRKRVNKEKFYNVWDREGASYIGFFGGLGWHIHTPYGIIVDESIVSFSSLPEGEVQDE